MGHAVVLSSWTLRIRFVVGGVPEPVRDSFSGMIGAPVRVAAAPVEQALASSRSDDHSRCSLRAPEDRAFDQRTAHPRPIRQGCGGRRPAGGRRLRTTWPGGMRGAAGRTVLSSGALSRFGQFPRRFQQFSNLILTLATRALHGVLSMFSPGLPSGWEGVPVHNRQAAQLVGVASFGGRSRGWVLRYAMVRRGPPR